MTLQEACTAFTEAWGPAELRDNLILTTPDAYTAYFNSLPPLQRFRAFGIHDSILFQGYGVVCRESDIPVEMMG